MTTAQVRRRYGRIARIYDVANLEWLLYAAARRRAVDMLQLQPGARVLDVACGTGANFALIRQRIGPTGVSDWEGAWAAMASLVRPGGRLAVMDAGDTGAAVTDTFTWGWVTAASGEKVAA